MRIVDGVKGVSIPPGQMSFQSNPKSLLRETCCPVHHREVRPVHHREVRPVHHREGLCSHRTIIAHFGQSTLGVTGELISMTVPRSTDHCRQSGHGSGSAWPPSGRPSLPSAPEFPYPSYCAAVELRYVAIQVFSESLWKTPLCARRASTRTTLSRWVWQSPFTYSKREWRTVS